MKLLKKVRKRLIWAAIIALLALTAASRQTEWWMERDTAEQIFVSIEDVPQRKNGVVLGCGKHLADGRQNLYFMNRIRAAHLLFLAGRIEYILVSGDNHTRDYNETSEMKAALLQLGIPEDIIVCDCAGFSTFDSVVRAREVFLEDTFTVVSQRFHLQFALFICNRKGIAAIGFCAADVDGYAGFKTMCREQLARLKTISDLYLFNRKPVFLGDPIPIGKK